MTFHEIISFGVIFIVILFGLYFGYIRIRSQVKGEPPEDELSRNLMQKASSTSFYISLYLWLAVMYFSDRSELADHTLIGAGILGMALTLCLSWIFYKIRGMRDA